MVAERSHGQVPRLLGLLRLLHQRRVVTRADIATELRGLYGRRPERTLRRDIAALAGRDVEELGEPENGENADRGIETCR